MNAPFAAGLAAAMLLASPLPASAGDWVPAWMASPQPVWSADFLFPTDVPATLGDRTVRQVARIGIGGTKVRIRLSNDHGRNAVRIAAAHLARSTGGMTINPASDRALTFGGEAKGTILPGASLLSDPVDITVAAGEDIAVSLHFAEAVPVETFHWDGKATSRLVQGLHVSDTDLPLGETITQRLFLSDILVDAPEAKGTVVVLGDSITDGAGATLGADTRWPDFLAARAAPRGIAVVNAGISGARLLSDRMGTNALARLDRDALAQPKIATLILMLGINDIAWPGTPFAPGEPPMTFERLTSGYRQIAARARANGVRIVGATLTPFAGALPGTPLEATYHSTAKDALRQRINDWIRTSGTFDAVADFDRLLADPAEPARLLPAYDSGDRLHPGDAGNQAMADAIDLDTILGDTP
ncbi:SGNH/GDSL hydrolase family protein [Aurantimonas aggregata]|uniref:SGNH/GDSL hydrolase family protein n=1 Tax=Aurantimonas aggregata TaxID=2047720 RepID=A0A6L9MN21_9HYPH|nr:SGNH/GDSL hydrolase family protein [Aurantimonas aggregata]NDV89151.1 SGNH/GDSL hydrolase family protein [Aurantimonas aggregata]